MRNPVVIALACALSCALLLWPRRELCAAAPVLDEELRKPFALELPDIGGGAYTAPVISVPTHELSRLTLRVYKPYADTINYGKIYTRINGESADVIFNFNSDLNGYVIRGDLSRWPRFRLLPGKNVVEIKAVDRNGKAYYASYVLLPMGGGPADGGLAQEAAVESHPVSAGPDRIPPTVYLTQPVGVARLRNDAGTVKVAGLAADNSGKVAAVSVNGREVGLVPASATRGLTVQTPPGADAVRNAMEFETTAALAAGVPAVVVEARDGAGNLTRVSVPVSRRVAAVSAAFRGRKFALVVGISKYKFHEGGLRDLAYADVDAGAVRDFLQRREGGGFAAGDIVFLDRERATAEAVRAALHNFLPKAGPSDLIFLFIAGHGGPDPYAPQNLYFMLHDTRLSDMQGTALPMEELQGVLKTKVRAERVVVFVDTCHSAGLSGEAPAATRGIENNLINLYVSQLYKETGRAVMTSSDVNELSREGEQWGGGHGVFTWALLEGFKGAADANADRFVTAGELFGYVRNRVRLETGFRQNPRIFPGLNADLALAVAR
jgi:hypothetical protein